MFEKFGYTLLRKRNEAEYMKRIGKKVIKLHAVNYSGSSDKVLRIDVSVVHVDFGFVNGISFYDTESCDGISEMLEAIEKYTSFFIN